MMTLRAQSRSRLLPIVTCGGSMRVVCRSVSIRDGEGHTFRVRLDGFMVRVDVGRGSPGQSGVDRKLGFVICIRR